MAESGKTTIRLLAKTVRFVKHLDFSNELGYRFSGIGSESSRAYDMPRSLVLNSEEIEEKIAQDPQQFLRIVTPESVVWQKGMDGITFSRKIDLPKK